MMAGTTRLRHPGAMYSPRNIQIARKCVRANIRPMVFPQQQAKFQPTDREADHVSLSLCRAYFPTTSGMKSDVVSSIHDY
jgi:hypothetical protein